MTDNAGAGAPNAAAAAASGGDAIEALTREIASVRHDNARVSGEARAASQQLGRIREVFAPAAEPTGDEWLDDVLSHALEAEKNGQPMPITVKIATQLAQTQEANRKLLEQVAKLSGDQARLNDPQVTADNAAYTSIDGNIADFVQEYYGGENTQIFDAIADAVAKEIKDLQKTNPKQWMQVRRDPKLHKAIVQHYGFKLIPPQARNIVSEVAEYSQPITVNDLKEALMQTAQIPDEALRERTKTKLRQNYWETTLNASNGRRRA